MIYNVPGCLEQFNFPAGGEIILFCRYLDAPAGVAAQRVSVLAPLRMLTPDTLNDVMNTTANKNEACLTVVMLTKASGSALTSPVIDYVISRNRHRLIYKRINF